MKTLLLVALLALAGCASVAFDATMPPAVLVTAPAAVTDRDGNAIVSGAGVAVTQRDWASLSAYDPAYNHAAADGGGGGGSQ